MSSDMPELGSKISLISKADIRYEGRLFTVDPQECTIALANVRSFGTEDRETQYPILPQPTIYDYILFRGSDIKDIRVVNNVTIPNDPAIVQLHLPPQQNQMPPQPPQGFQPGYGPMPSMGGPPQMNPQFVGGPFMQGPNQGNMSQGQANTSGNLSSAAPGSSINKQNKTSSRSTTPNNLSRKSPTAEMGVQTNQNQQNAAGNKDKPNNNKMNQRNQPRGDRDQNQRERRDSGKIDQRDHQRDHQPRDHQRDHQQRDQQRDHNNYRQNNRNNNQQQMNNNRGWVNRGNNRGNAGSIRMRGRSGGPPQGYRQNNQGNVGNPGINKQQGGNRPKSTLKFENDYDFEQANSKFEELRSQIAKLKVGEEVKPEEKVNGEVDKKDDSGNETGAGDNEPDDVEAGYDKRKSFFDNISCEAVERSKGKTQRTDWRQERKLNSETFGISMARRGNFRGRGGYYNNRGPQNFRGGNNNYRGGNNNGNYRSIRGGQGGGQNRNAGNSQRNQQPQPQQNNPQQPTAAQVVAGN